MAKPRPTLCPRCDAPTTRFNERSDVEATTLMNHPHGRTTLSDNTPPHTRLPASSGRHPVQHVCHGLCYFIDQRIFRALDDELIVHVAADVLVLQVLHGVAEDIPGYSLDNVFYEFGAVGLYPFPFFRSSYPHVGDDLISLFSHLHGSSYVGQSPAGGQLDEEDALLHEDGEESYPHDAVIFDSLFHRPIYFRPVVHDVRVRGPPEGDQGLQFFFCEAHVQGTHGFQGSFSAAVAKGQFCNFSFLPKVAVDAVLHHGYMEQIMPV